MRMRQSKTTTACDGSPAGAYPGAWLSNGVPAAAATGAVSPTRIDPFAPLPHALLTRLVQLYFEYKFWLAPYPHRPSFERDFARRREQQAGQDEWVALVYGMATNALMLPARLLPVSADEAKRLVMVSFEHMMGFLKREYDEYSVDRLYIIACAANVAQGNGHTALCRELIGSMIFLAVQRNLDRESTYAALPPLEREMSRRIWWLVYCADRAGATCEGARPVLNEETCAGVALPSTLDDEALELATAGLEVPLSADDKAEARSPSPLWGFFYSAAQWRVAGKIYSRRERDQAIPPEPGTILQRIVELDEIIEELDDLLVDVPAFLALKPDAAAVRTPDTPVATSKQGIVVQQSNIWVTQQAIRLVAVQYRRELVDLRWSAAPPPNAVVPRSDILAVHKLHENERAFLASRDLIVGTLLSVLQALPLELVAVNTCPAISMIRFVASTLLTDHGGDSLSLGHLQQYIDYLSRLESCVYRRI
ncbi:uncharacterized protein LOC62_01G000728 [Vanrija pseudolonga]|uniref:Xylanolytic transcriptional activator regulatory domain-containing protein n=1 Tax=Vanrija pseudolonga TaxID=143232 RepID=A0AAF0XZX8_9TREE|nr:hypothetical protein LOC62_01G000728 [Vanrija pseudolonga]